MLLPLRSPFFPRGALRFLLFAGSLPGVAGAWAQSNLPQAPGGPAITLTSPLNYQVFQRRTRFRGNIAVLGQAHVHADRVEARVTGNRCDRCPWMVDGSVFPSIGPRASFTATCPQRPAVFIRWR